MTKPKIYFSGGHWRVTWGARCPKFYREEAIFFAARLNRSVYP